MQFLENGSLKYFIFDIYGLLIWGGGHNVYGLGVTMSMIVLSQSLVHNIYTLNIDVGLVAHFNIDIATPHKSVVMSMVLHGTIST